MWPRGKSIVAFADTAAADGSVPARETAGHRRGCGVRSGRAFTARFDPKHGQRRASRRIVGATRGPRRRSLHGRRRFVRAARARPVPAASIPASPRGRRRRSGNGNWPRSGCSDETPTAVDARHRSRPRRSDRAGPSHGRRRFVRAARARPVPAASIPASPRGRRRRSGKCPERRRRPRGDAGIDAAGTGLARAALTKRRRPWTHVPAASIPASPRGRRRRSGKCRAGRRRGRGSASPGAPAVPPVPGLALPRPRRRPARHFPERRRRPRGDAEDEAAAADALGVGERADRQHRLAAGDETADHPVAVSSPAASRCWRSARSPTPRASAAAASSSTRR
jgi:hypothetical protein